MRREDIVAFARRDWEAVAASKDEHWLGERRRRGVRWCFELADELRRQVLARQPTWPSAEERADDLAAHVRLSTALRRVAGAGSR